MRRRMRHSANRSQSGYSLIELMMVVSVTGILGSMVTLQLGAVRPGMQADGAMRVVMAELNSAREIAVSRRRQVRVEFVGNNGLRVTQIDVPSGETELRNVAFEAGLQFGLVEGAGDTPDGFGNTSATPENMLFGSDGMLIDESGEPVNRTIFLVIPNTPQAFRAVTVLGSTGRVRTYRWNGSTKWMRT